MTASCRLHSALALAALLAALGCAAGTGADGAPGPTGRQTIGPEGRVKTDPGKADSSALAVFVDLEFDAELVTTSAWSPNEQIEDQLLYTIGHLNGDRSLGRLDQLALSDVEVTDLEGEHGKKLVTYHARLPVAWGRKNDVPTEYTLRLPRDVSYEGTRAFTEKYDHDCVDPGAHDVDTGSMWYYYRPRASRCELAEEDVVTATATVTVSEINTTGKYPEYHEVWRDGVLNVVAVFGKYESGATSDVGITGYDTFVREVRKSLDGHELATTPPDLPASPGVDHPDVELTAVLDDDHRVRVNALLVDNVRTAGQAFDRRYEDLSSAADLVTYNGHAGLGANIRALARKGRWVAGQYVMVFMNGCDTYAYVDSALFDAHARVNDDDPTGTKYTDIVTNALPSFFRSMPHATLALFRGLLSYDEPKTYERMFRDVDSSQVVLVSGEQDNVYFPGYEPDGEGGEEWAGFVRSGRVAAEEEARFETPALRSGRYRFDLDGTGDADLYVRVGEPPTTSSYDCRPFRYGSQETCVVDITSAAPIHVLVRGWDPLSSFSLTGRREP